MDKTLKAIVRKATLGIGLSFIVGCAATSDKPGRKLILPDAPGAKQESSEIIYVGEGPDVDSAEQVELEIEEESSTGYKGSNDRPYPDR